MVGTWLLVVGCVLLLGSAAGLISAFLDGLDDASALERASAVGALATTHRGDRDGLPTRAGLDAFTAAAAMAPTT